jgi:GntR family transcriptional regulator
VVALNISDRAMKKAPHKWHDRQPIYRQLMDRLIHGILEKHYPEGDYLPSVRQLAADFQINPLTVAKAYKELARDGLIELQRGEGLTVARGARAALLRRERSKFLKEEWPSLRSRLRVLEIDLRTLEEGT